jgi:hypothetical protein
VALALARETFRPGFVRAGSKVWRLEANGKVYESHIAIGRRILDPAIIEEVHEAARKAALPPAPPPPPKATRLSWKERLHSGWRALRTKEVTAP